MFNVGDKLHLTRDPSEGSRMNLDGIDHNDVLIVHKVYSTTVVIVTCKERRYALFTKDVVAATAPVE